MKMTRIVVSLLFFFALFNITYSHPVDGEKIVLMQPDGTSVVGYIFGDEYYHRIETKEGYSIVKNEQTGYIEYALKEDGRLIPSGMVVGRVHTQRLEMLQIRKHLSGRAEKIAQLRITRPEIFHEKATRTATIDPEGRIQTLTGTKKVFLVCVDFPSEASPPTKWSSGTYSPNNYNQRIFSTNPNDVSMVNFFKAASFNQFWPEGYTYPSWVTLPQTATWYKDNSSWRQIVQDAMDQIKSQDPSFDFTQYANNGTMDIIVIWAGTRMEWADFFWPKMGGVRRTIHGVYVNYYNAVNERQNSGAENTGISVFCHEYGHMTGTPDLYDYSDFHNKPMGYYCVMGSSNYAYNFCGYIKYKVYGWVNPVDIVQSGSYSVDALALMTAKNPRLYKVNIEPPLEYLLIENRNHGAHPVYEYSTWRESGLLISHIDENYGPAVCQPSYPFYGVEAITPWLDPTITKLSTYQTYWNRMTFSADNGYTQIGPTYPDNTVPGAYLVLTSDDDTEHVILRNTRGHRVHVDININKISGIGNTMTFDVTKEHRTLTMGSTAGGTTSPAPGVHVFDKGRQIDVSAIEDQYHAFTGWTGDIYPFNPQLLTLPVTMDQNRSLTAHFSRISTPSGYSAQRVLNRSLSQGEYINVIKWSANPQNAGVNIAYYRVYKIDGGARELMQAVDSDVFEYWHRNVENSGTYTYHIVAVTSSSREGEPAVVTIN
ncbi:M6 family metalloprotease domain-containing protein [Acidobacteriota bacterium]